MKQPTKNNINVFCRWSIMDFAIGLPFSLNVEAKSNLEYEILFDNQNVIRDFILCDQGDDKYLHLCFDKVDKDAVFPFFKAFSEDKNLPIVLKIHQGDRLLLENRFYLDDDVYVLLHDNLDRAMICSSKIRCLLAILRKYFLCYALFWAFKKSVK